KQFLIKVLYLENWVPFLITSPPYTASLNKGCPIYFIWVRIWWVRPVSNLHCTRDTYRNLLSTFQWVIAFLPWIPSGKTSMTFLFFGLRPICASMVPSSAAGSPHISAR